jgi:hypothetical protein
MMGPVSGLRDAFSTMLWAKASSGRTGILEFKDLGKPKAGASRARSAKARSAAIGTSACQERAADCPFAAT